jgi:predicted aspartyl protease
MRRIASIIASLSVLAALLPVTAFAQDQPEMSIGLDQLPALSTPQQCTAPEIVNALQLIHLANRDGDLVPVTINGAARNFLLDTGAYVTQVQRPVAEALQLSIQPGETDIVDLTGKVSNDEAAINDFSFGRLHDNNTQFPVSPDIESARTSDGFFAMDHMLGHDIDLDFGSDRLIFYAPDHCPRTVPYWAMKATAVIPITLEDNHIIVPVTLDGKSFRAWVDTGATFTALDMDDAQTLYGLTMGDAATPENGTLNEDAELKTYSHTFTSLSFGDVRITGPHVTIIPNAMAESLAKSRVAGTPPGRPVKPVEAPQLIIGMDVLRKLHLYMSLAEGKMYLSRASEPTAQAQALQVSLQPQAALQARFRQVAAKQITEMDQIIAADPQNVPALNERCYMRAAVKGDLDAALADCDAAIRLRPRDDTILDSRAFVLYQQGRYSEALAAYDQVLLLKPRSAPSLLMRGYARGMLGDSRGKDADIAAAIKAMPGIARSFQQYDISY